MDWSKPIEIAEDIFWVGSKIPKDKFQCHVYLLRYGGESVLFDPGSMLTFDDTLAKIRSLIDPYQIKYFVCHHQDPDITASISQYERLFPREDRLVVTHWRTHALLRHYNWQAGFYLVDEHDWRLQLSNGRTIEFIFTPYAHFAGAICSYDHQTKTLFSSDIFGGFISRDTIFADDVSCFEDIRLFHEHYMPSREILLYALDEISKLELNLIAPQHGYILTKKWIAFFLEQLRNLECGLFKFSKDTRDVALLSKMARFFQETVTALINCISFEEILKHLQASLYQLFGVEDLSVLAFTESEYLFYRPISGLKKYFIPRNKYQEINTLLEKLEEKPFLIVKSTDLMSYCRVEGCSECLVLPLFLNRQKLGLAFLAFRNSPFAILQAKDFLKKLSSMLTHLLNKELEVLSAEKAKEEFYNFAVKDQLTGVYNRFYLNVQMKEFISNVIRYNIPVSIILLDIDFFKKINDTYGHLIGDQVLKRLAEILKNSLRHGDTIVRYGGEEFLIILPYTYPEEACKIAERLRESIAKQPFSFQDLTVNVTISAGVAFWQSEIKSLEELICLADDRLYRAKKSGRNRVVCE